MPPLVSATPVADSRVAYCDEQNAGSRAQGIQRLAIVPAVPRTGDQVTVTGSGLKSGEYSLRIAQPAESRADVGPFSVGSDGALSATFPMPKMFAGVCVTVSLDSRTVAPAFISPG